MSVLNREELIENISSNKIIDSTIISEDLKKEYYKDSSIQPCSVDLHIGEIYIPDTPDTNRGGLLNPIKNKSRLKPGGSFLVRTLETINMPCNMGGICFAPATISLQGLLIVNIGHIDPGFCGKLHFTVVNLSKDDIDIYINQVISTLLIFELSKNTEAFGNEKTVPVMNYKVPEVVNNSLPHLSRTFMDSENTIKKAVNRASLTTPIITAVLTTVVAALIAFAISAFSNSGYDAKIATIEYQLDNLKLEIVEIQNTEDNNYLNRLDTIEKEIDSLKQQP